MPARNDLDPIDLGATMLPFLALTDVIREDERLRFRFRISGSAINQGAGVELSGHFIDTVNPNPIYTAYIEGLYRKAVDARRPVFSGSSYVTGTGRTKRLTKRMMCPLSSDGAIVDAVITAQVFESVGRGVPPGMTYADRFDPGIVQFAD